MTYQKCPSVAVGTMIVLIAVSGARSSEGQSVGVRTVSSRPEAVTGEATLVQIYPVNASGWTAQLNDRDVTSSFRPTASGELLALLSGLKPGHNLITIRVDGATKTSLALIDHPLSGPIFSGPHQRPFICQTAVNGLGPPIDANCDTKTVVQYYYKSTLPPGGDWIKAMLKSIQVAAGAIPAGLPTGFRPYDLRAGVPSDAAQTVTSDGRTVPYIIRREIGVINRAVYDIRFLHQPGQPFPTPWTGRGPAWNGRLVYVFPGGCSAGYRQGILDGPANDEVLLAQGYAVATSTLNSFGNNCNDVVSAETVSMLKEHFIKRFGAPVHTIGWGDSGGAMELYLIAQNYPGLLDGIVPYISFPDIVTYVTSTSDCSLLTRAFARLQHPLTDEQKSTVSGFATWRTCLGLDGFAISPQRCDAAIPRSEIFDAADRPKGIRCDIYDNEVSVFGRDLKTGFAARPLDNVGIEYGLVAFKEGKIDADQFVALNEQAGGFDTDGNIVADRTQADSGIVRQAYQHGVVVTGAGGLRETPIIDWRWYGDDLGDNHDSFRSFVTRARLTVANGNAANQVILIDSRAATLAMELGSVTDANPETSLIARRERDLVGQMDRWLDAIAADSGAGPLADKVVRDRPADVSDGCWTVDGGKRQGTDVFGASGACSQLYPQHGDPRIAAGGPLTDDILKCKLKPISGADYSQPLTADELHRLQAVFPAGVCDYSRPGVGQQVSTTTWERY